MIQTAPDHPLGDFPVKFWNTFKHSIPEDLSGWNVLDIGCNAGFYSFEMKRRGAARVLGVDHDPEYLAQARFAGESLGLDVEFRELDVHNIDHIDERFDLVIFMGIFYHLRHPLYVLEKVARLTRKILLFQTMERGPQEVLDVPEDFPITERGVFSDERFPRMHFIENRFAGDPTNWWIPNPAASQAMLRSAGMRIVDHPCYEVYVCEPALASSNEPRSRGRAS